MLRHRDIWTRRVDMENCGYSRFTQRPEGMLVGLGWHSHSDGDLEGWDLFPLRPCAGYSSIFWPPTMEGIRMTEYGASID